MDALNFLARDGLLPHGVCFAWSPGLLWAMATADGLIALAYFTIPLAIIQFVRNRPGGTNHGVAWLFCAFIFACGLTHVMDIWTIWRPDYAAQAVVKAVTAAISVASAVALWLLMPRALAIPTVRELQSAIQTLEAEVRKRKSAEQQLHETEQNLSVTLASIDAGFIATDRSGRVTRMNPVAERITGWTQAEARGCDYWTVFQREGRPADLLRSNPVDAMMARGVTAQSMQEVMAVARDGTRSALQVRAALAVDDRAGAPVRGMVVVFRDMTRLNFAETELHRLAAIVSSSNDAIVGKTLDGRITNWNAAAERMFGYSAEEAIGRSVQMLIPPERAAEEMRILSNLVRGEVVPPFETLRLGKGGVPLEVSVTISPIRDAMGRIIGGSKIARDIGLQKRAEEARLTAQRLEVQNRQILEASRIKSQFLANMSHELRTPLNAIIGFSDLLHSGAVPVHSPKYHEFLGHISTSGHHLLQLINDVLDLSKVEAGKFEFFPEPVDLPALVGEVVTVLEATVQRKQLNVAVDIDVSVQQLEVDPARLKQVLYNYLSNAIKFTSAGGQVTVRARTEGPSMFRLEVEDTGIGIAAGDLPRLFVEFQQLDAGHAREHQGTGLGLALTRRLVEAQGGAVGVRSAPGVGSVFHMVLGRRLFALTNAHRVLAIEQPAGGAAGIAQAMTSAGFQVDTAASSEQAVAHASGRVYHAITLNLSAPESDGLGVLGTLRNRGLASTSPVVGLSVSPAGASAAAFAIADVFSKPLRGEEVLQAMRRLHLVDHPGARVMVIDDDPLALALMQSTLEVAGVQPVCVQDGRSALRLLRASVPDAIVLDLMMPVFDGFAVLEALSEMPALRDTPVFIWTSMLLTDDEFAQLSRSAQAILSKGGGAVVHLLERLRRLQTEAVALQAAPGA